MSGLPKISTTLWFDKEAEAAASHYVKAIAGSAILGIEHYGKAGPAPPPAQKPLCHLRSPGLRFGLGSMFSSRVWQLNSAKAESSCSRPNCLTTRGFRLPPELTRRTRVLFSRACGHLCRTQV